MSRLITINGVTKSLSQWCRESGIKSGTLHNRLEKGWPEDKLLRDVEKQEPIYIPTPEEINQECKKLQAGWSDNEKKARAGLPLDGQQRTKTPKVYRSVRRYRTHIGLEPSMAVPVEATNY